MKKTLPMLPLRGKYIFPNTVIHFDVSRSRSVKAIEEAMEHDQMIFLNNQIDPTAEDPGIEDLYRVGTLARIKQVVKLPKNILRVFAEGLFRAELSETVEYEPFYKVEVLYDHVEQQSFEEFEREAFLRMIKEAFEGYAKAWPHLDQNIVNYILLLTDVEILVDELATHIPFSYPEKQKLLEEMDLKERCELMLVMLQEELDVLKLKQKIQQKVKVNIDKNQKEYVLREQIKVIREELGETNVEDEADEFMEKLKNLKASDEVKEKLKKEISRFQTMGNQTPESSVLRTYIETMFEVPWEEMSEDSTDLDHAQQVLDRDHYGMEKVKERVLEYLAARAMSGKKDAAILCLVGPPGTGKTLLAKAVAGEANVPFFSISGSDFVEMFVGVGAARVRDLFAEAKKHSPCIVFIDEIDAVARRRGSGLGGGHDEREQTLNQMLVEMDGFGVNEGIIMIAATNRVDILDPAILRPGRFDRKVGVGRPDVKGREDILKIHCRQKPLGDDVDLHEIARTTAGFVGADLENLMNEAAIQAARDDRAYIMKEDIDKSFIKVGIGTEKKSRVVPESERRITAYHESGHAILFHLLPDVGPVYTVSIIPTGTGAAGYTMPLPENDNVFMTRGKMIQDIMVSLGGRIAEELILDDITTGASQDIKQVTQYARAMVTKFGMSDELGLINYDSGEGDEVFLGKEIGQQRPYGENTQTVIDQEVKKIVNKCYKDAKAMIEEHIDVLHKCAALLLEKERINRAEFEALFEPETEVETQA